MRSNPRESPWLEQTLAFARAGWGAARNKMRSNPRESLRLEQTLAFARAGWGARAQ
jgi:hypothetical protein